jgi:hypothetical protein
MKSAKSKLKLCHQVVHKIKITKGCSIRAAKHFHQSFSVSPWEVCTPALL